MRLVQHGGVFTPGPAPGNPPKCDLVVKVLEQEYYKEHGMSSVSAWGAGCAQADGYHSSPTSKQGFLARSQ